MRALALLAALAACGAEGYRDTGAPISSAALFDPARFAGTWYEVARYPEPDGCSATATFAPLADGRLAVTDGCTRGVAEVVGPGRLSVRLDGAAEATPVWVLWVDEGYRTAVLGDPSGRAGRILNRDPQIPADRLAAAREVLDFNGYDLAQLVTVAP